MDSLAAAGVFARLGHDETGARGEHAGANLGARRMAADSAAATTDDAATDATNNVCLDATNNVCLELQMVGPVTGTTVHIE